MRKIYAILAVLTVFVAQHAFAMETDDLSAKECKKIANSCIHAGFKGKAFWQDCMQPVLLNHPVKGVVMDSKDISACREFKISKMQTELDQLQKAQAK